MICVEDLLISNKYSFNNGVACDNMVLVRSGFVEKKLIFLKISGLLYSFCQSLSKFLAPSLQVG
jgi:hypothetical protein